MIALITGASSGIGLAYAHELAQRGYDLILVSNQEVEIHQTATDIHQRWHVTTHPIHSDLTANDACQDIYNWCKERDIQVDLLINNAGVFFFNDIINTSHQRVNTMLQLHIIATTQLTHLFATDMAQRKKGHILNMSSLSAWVKFPGISSYNASKAYILSLSNTLYHELREHGVSITAVCPGAIDTGLYGLSPYWRRIAVRLGVSMPPEIMAHKAINRTLRGKKTYTPGIINHIALPFLKHLPSWIIRLIRPRIQQFMK